MAGYETPPKYKPDVPVPPDGARLHELASAYPFCCMECARERVNQLEQALASEREIVRRLLVLGDYGYPTEHFEKHRDEPGFLSVEWLREYFGDPLPDYIVEALSAAGADAK